jgi:hypothetical protein
MNPEHFSRDVASRCMSLLRRFEGEFDAKQADDGTFEQAPETTFLLALAMPMLILPLERIFKSPVDGGSQGADREIDAELRTRIDKELGCAKHFGSSPFGKKGDWRYISCYPHSGFNIADAWPSALNDRLNSNEASSNAKVACASCILSDLRNALAHGGVAYLDEVGRTSENPVKMLAFVAKKSLGRKVLGLSVLRVSTSDFRAFLEAWAKWLDETTVAQALNSSGVAGVSD